MIGKTISHYKILDKVFELLFQGSESDYLQLKNRSFYKNLLPNPYYEKILDPLKTRYDEFLTIFKKFLKSTKRFGTVLFPANYLPNRR